MQRWALFISGRGSTAQAVIEMGALANIALVISSKESALGIKKARRLGIPTLVTPLVAGSKVIDYSQIQFELLNRSIDQIFLLGYMKIIPGSFLKLWAGRIWNVHPSLLPAFRGSRALERSFEEGAELGASIHGVIEELDAGPVVLQKRMPNLRRPSQKQPATLEDVQTAFSIQEQTLVRRWFELNNFQSRNLKG